MPYPLAGRRVLVAEDLYLIAVTLSESLARAGAEVLGPFPTCADCLATIKKQHFDAAVLDIALTDGSVFPVARELVHEGIPFLFVSGYGPDKLPREFADAPFLLKPGTEDEICKQVVALLKVPPT